MLYINFKNFKYNFIYKCRYTDKRAIALGAKWLAFSRDGAIVLCNLITFANSPAFIKAHEGKVTALAFHPEDGQLLSAGTDSKVR